MGIKSRLSILMGEKRYNMQDVFERTGISRNSISNLYHERSSRIDFETLSRLCDLFDCQPSDILLNVKEEKETEYE